MCGRRWGKTVCLAAIIIKTAFSKPNTLTFYVAPTYNRSSKFFNLLCFSCSELIESTKQKPIPTIKWRNGSVTECHSFQEPNNLRGDGVSLICLDEACYVKEEHVNLVLMPMLSDTRGKLVLASTPAGFDWVWDRYEKGQIENNPLRIKSFRFPTSTGIRFQSAEGKAELELMKATFPKLHWQQEYECMPIAGVNRVFAEEDLLLNIFPDVHNGPIAGRKYIIGCDIGRVRDRGAYVVISDIGQIVECYAFPIGTAYQSQAEKVAIAAQRWNNARVLLDSTGGGMGANKSDLLYGPDAALTVYRNRIPNIREVIWNQINKQKMVDALCVDIENKKLRIPSSMNELIMEMKTYEFKVRLGRYFYAAKDGCRDDLVAGLLMANIGRRNNWFADDTGKSIRF